MIPIDQSEELFAAENIDAARTLELLVKAVLADGNAIIVATIRSDAFARMQEAPPLLDILALPFSLAAMPHGSFKEVIEGPARLANPPLTIEPALSEQLLNDLATDDALPLLAFTLERLLRRRRDKSVLTLADYSHEMGGLQGAIRAAVEEAFAKAQRDPSLPRIASDWMSWRRLWSSLRRAGRQLWPCFLSAPALTAPAVMEGCS